MARSRILFYVILAVAGLIVGGHAVLASADPPPGSTPIPTSTVTAERGWHVTGVIQSMNGEFWNIQGSAVRVTTTTHIVGDLPVVGSYVEAQGIVKPDGTRLVTELRVGRTPSKAAAMSPVTAASTPSTVADRETPVPSPTPTVTPTVTPTQSLLSTATQPVHGRGHGHGPKNEHKSDDDHEDDEQ
jgi:hypothetical protein